MKIIFAGTPDFAAVALQAIVAAGHTVSLVLTQPDRPKGRGMKAQASAVKQMAETLGLPVFQPLNLKDAADQQVIAAEQADVMVVAAYGLILPQAVLDLPRLGCLNIHASLLPRWRGAAPIQRAIEAGDAETGVCIMQMAAGLDTGDVLHTVRTDISATDTGLSVHDRLTELGAEAVVATLANLEERVPEPQPEDGVTYAHKLSKEEAMINWAETASVIDRKIRAFNPVPTAWTLLDGVNVKVWAASIQARSGNAGEVLAASPEGLLVGTGAGSLLITEWQVAGSKRMGMSAYLAGKPVPVGTVLGQAVNA
ncbi:MAG: methionyl-tRNA formyltransferase [Neisseriaceae bacterium]|nr:methionyl-tRNA formyltransferase [Neisseriaceae bacterium]MBP6862484.1 methionyl-tRNA formyltransferase [Neisseriaceae bacterium]